jgi:hypothetical protein
MTSFQKLHALTAAIAILVGTVALSAAQSNNAASQQTADAKEIHDYQLTTDKLTRYETAAKAVQKILKDNPALQQKLDSDSQNNSGPNSIAQSAAALDKQTQLVAVIKSAGFGTHEYVVATYTLMVSESYVAMKKSVPNTPMPPSVSPANAAFAEANFARIQVLAQETMGGGN